MQFKSPKLSIYTGSINKTRLLYKNIHQLIKLPTWNLTDSNCYWKISPHWEDGGTKEDFVYANEGFDKSVTFVFSNPKIIFLSCLSLNPRQRSSHIFRYCFFYPDSLIFSKDL